MSELQFPVNLNKLLADLEAEYITEALKKTNGSVKAAGELLGLKRTTLLMRLRTHTPKQKEPKFEAPKVVEEDLWGPDPWANERDL